MKIIYLVLIYTLGALISPLQANTCPLPPNEENPDVTPENWVVYPLSKSPQYENGITFVKAQIPPKAISGVNGIICIYETPHMGYYSIWQDKLAKKMPVSQSNGMPSCLDYWFSDKREGDTCSESIEKCPFIISK